MSIAAIAPSAEGMVAFQHRAYSNQDNSFRMGTSEQRVLASVNNEPPKAQATSINFEAEDQYRIGTNLVTYLRDKLVDNSPITTQWLMSHLSKASLLAANPGLVSLFNNNFSAANEFINGTWNTA